MNKNIKLLVEAFFYNSLNEKFESTVFSQFFNSCKKLNNGNCNIYIAINSDEPIIYNLISLYNGKTGYVPEDAKIIFNKNNDIMFKEKVFNSSELEKAGLKTINTILPLMKKMNLAEIIFNTTKPLITKLNGDFENANEVSINSAIILKDKKNLFGMKKTDVIKTLMSMGEKLENQKNKRMENMRFSDPLASNSALRKLLDKKDKLSDKQKNLLQSYLDKNIESEDRFKWASNDYIKKYGKNKASQLKRVIDQVSQEEVLIKQFYNGWVAMSKEYYKLFNKDVEKVELKQESAIKLFRILLWEIAADKMFITNKDNGDSLNDLYYQYDEAVIYHFVQNEECRKWLYNFYETWNPNGMFLTNYK